jgi:hypothetical protein
MEAMADCKDACMDINDYLYDCYVCTTMMLVWTSMTTCIAAYMDNNDAI